MSDPCAICPICSNRIGQNPDCAVVSVSDAAATERELRKRFEEALHELHELDPRGVIVEWADDRNARQVLISQREIVVD